MFLAPQDRCLSPWLSYGQVQRLPFSGMLDELHLLLPRVRKPQLPRKGGLGTWQRAKYLGEGVKPLYARPN